ncbi:hypothetical protein ARMGADRAFT_1019414 [Armillaria gallica]|uniref:Uncharacterized protein n=1 Tax=Armillaria gallica TaxID=47427 RepID=A0A2H3CI66_ARMGA|nr:hypothetical protein ARMGADRAFT_1019414 [Armillaria gallica]
MNWFPALRSQTEQKKCRKLFWRIDREHLNPTGVLLTVGDFGTVDPETGDFEREGNVFEHPASKEVMAEHDPIRNASTVRHAHIIKCTKNVRQIDVPLGGGIGLTGIAEGNVTVQYRFGSKRGVLLFMRDVTFTRFPIGKPWADKLSDIPVFWDKVIVAETYSCRHYDLRMGKGGEHSVEITGTAEIPIPAAPALSASANVGFKIAGKAGFGSVWHGTKNTETESDGFVPMYRLKGFRTLRYESAWRPDEWVVYDIPPPGYKGRGMPGPAGELDKDGKDIFSSDEDEAGEEEAGEEDV